MQRKQTGLIGSLAVAGSLIGGPPSNSSETSAMTTITSTRRETLAEDPHTHIDTEPHPVTRETVAGQSGAKPVPFIDSSAMDAANQVAIRARHDLIQATIRVALMANSFNAAPQACEQAPNYPSSPVCVPSADIVQ
jgi:hypothetical protein